MTWRLIQADTGSTVANALEIADGFWSRFKGLQFRAALPAGTGLLLVPCPSVHTFFVRFAIDVISIDRTGRVVAVRRHVKPWRIVPPTPGGYATLEMPAGAARVNVGDSLRLEPTSGEIVPPSVTFLFHPK